MGISKAMIHQWDGKKWTTEKKIYEADMSIIKPMIDQAAKKYAGEKKLEYRDCAKDAS
jgi:branched-chain amino acid transport system substrate-binding protein